ncbi:50S ribosome-binding protein YggL [Pseudomarimonas arenosa]|uniref:DUF469 family protein n=1 Tax=Pseudomarimonas arenosa TaxID=2774145 RepID=A0AAW3ZP42_9GAMM|nr:50S ribosome-binding protein YggL [Pseudomarimonas arenosa]MBD8526409.1 DUF469 family protein [Pseudomarimonas arenosa]
MHEAHRQPVQSQLEQLNSGLASTHSRSRIRAEPEIRMRFYTLRPHHRRRHRKKFKLAEFAEFGFALRGADPSHWADQPDDRLLAFVDYQGWCFDGERQPLDGFVSRFGGGSLTEVDRELMRSWLAEQGADRIDVGPLQDHWEWVSN